jgi:hypothetical protein
MFVLDFLMATILGLVVTEKTYFIFHAGDGLLGINGRVQCLEGEEGIYLGTHLVRSGDDEPLPTNSLKLFASGATQELDSIILASDGLVRLACDHSDHFRAFIAAKPAAKQVRNGVDFLLQEFRHRFAWNPRVAPTLEDDATFVLLRRVDRELTGDAQDY